MLRSTNAFSTNRNLVHETVQLGSLKQQNPQFNSNQAYFRFNQSFNPQQSSNPQLKFRHRRTFRDRKLQNPIRSKSQASKSRALIRNWIRETEIEEKREVYLLAFADDHCMNWVGSLRRRPDKASGDLLLRLYKSVSDFPSILSILCLCYGNQTGRYQFCINFPM